MEQAFIIFVVGIFTVILAREIEKVKKHQTRELDKIYDLVVRIYAQTPQSDVTYSDVFTTKINDIKTQWSEFYDDRHPLE